MSVSWSQNVNTKFYNLSYGVNENTESISFESGKKRTFLKNSTPQKKFDFSLSFWSQTEEQAFWTWYEDVLLSGSECVILTNLLTGTGTKEYRFTSTPQVSDGLYPRTCKISVEEF